MANTCDFDIDSIYFNEAKYLDEFLKTANIEQILERKKKVEHELNSAIKNREKAMAELEFKVVNGIKNVKNVKNDTVKMESQCRLVESEFQELWNLDKPHIIEFNKYIDEYKSLELIYRTICMRKIPKMIKSALECNDITKTLILLSNIYNNYTDSADVYSKELEEILSQLKHVTSDIEQMVTLHVLSGSFLLTESLYHHLMSIKVDELKSQTLHVLNCLNLLNHQLKMVINCNDESLFNLSLSHLERLAALNQFIQEIKCSTSDLCIYCAIGNQISCHDFEDLLCNFRKNGGLSSVCLKCHLSPLLAKLLSTDKSDDMITLINRSKSIDPNEYNYSLIVESIKFATAAFNSKLDMIKDDIVSNLDLFINNFDSKNFNPIFQSIKECINNIHDMYVWITEFVTLDTKLIFLNICSHFVHSVMSIFCHISLKTCSIEFDASDKELTDQHYIELAKSLTSLDWQSSMLENYILFNPFVNAKDGLAHSDSLDSIHNSNKLHIYNTNCNIISLLLRLIMHIKTSLLPHTIDYMNTIFNHFDSQLKDINLYDFLNIRNDCAKCKHTHSIEIVPFSNSINTVTVTFKMLVSETLLNSSVKTAMDISKKIISLELVRNHDLKGPEGKRVQLELMDLKELFKSRLETSIKLLEIIPENNSTFLFEKCISSRKLYIKIDSLLDDRCKLIEYYIYLVINQLIEFLRSEYINSSLLLNTISQELFKVTLDLFNSHGMPLAKSIGDLWNGITKSIYRNR